jgi:hypothetical protein
VGALSQRETEDLAYRHRSDGSTRGGLFGYPRRGLGSQRQARDDFGEPRFGHGLAEYTGIRKR